MTDCVKCFGVLGDWVKCSEYKCRPFTISFQSSSLVIPMEARRAHQTQINIYKQTNPSKFKKVIFICMTIAALQIHTRKTTQQKSNAMCMLEKNFWIVMLKQKYFNLFSENNNKPRTVVICGCNAAFLYLVLLYLHLFCGKIIFKVSFFHHNYQQRKWNRNMGGTLPLECRYEPPLDS